MLASIPNSYWLCFFFIIFKFVSHDCKYDKETSQWDFKNEFFDFHLILDAKNFSDKNFLYWTIHGTKPKDAPISLINIFEKVNKVMAHLSVKLELCEKSRKKETKRPVSEKRIFLLYLSFMRYFPFRFLFLLWLLLFGWLAFHTHLFDLSYYYCGIDKAPTTKPSTMDKRIYFSCIVFLRFSFSYDNEMKQKYCYPILKATSYGKFVIFTQGWILCLVIYRNNAMPESMICIEVCFRFESPEKWFWLFIFKFSQIKCKLFIPHNRDHFNGYGIWSNIWSQILFF